MEMSNGNLNWIANFIWGIAVYVILALGGRFAEGYSRRELGG